MQFAGLVRSVLIRSVLVRGDRNQSNTAGTSGGRRSLSEHLALLMLIDGILVLLIVWVATVLVPYVFGADLSGIATSPFWQWFPLLLGTWWLFASLHDLYDLSALHRRIRTAIRVITASLGVALVCYLITLFIPTGWVLEITLLFLATAIPLLILWRLAYVSLTASPSFRRRTLIVGSGKRARHAAELVKQHSFLNYQILGYMNNGADMPEMVLDGLPVLTNPKELATWAQQTDVHEIVIAADNNLDEQLILSLIECQANGVQVVWLSELYERFRHNVPVDQVDPQWILHAVQAEPAILQRIAKRLLDLVVVFFALPTLLIFIPLVALAIKLDSPGPVFYRQVRSGRAGKPFMIYKFRTMYIDAEKDGKARWATKGDPRITRVGRLLRKTRLDELPQVLNILRGNMSIVGPRPERPEFVEELKQAIPYYHTRLLMKPGLTGWAQIQYDYTSTIEDTVTKLQYDLYYIHRWSLWLDIYIMFRTVSVVLGMKGT